MTSSFSSIPSDQLLAQLGTSIDEGLTTEVATLRLQDDRNRLKNASSNLQIIRLLVRQFTNPLVLLLVIAIILSAMLGAATDTVIILFILLISGLLGFWQELSAGRAIERLRKIIRLKANVLRNGKEEEIDTDYIVPGDIIILNAGDIIPADCRLLDDNELHVNESTITGESFPVEKSPGNVDDDAVITEKCNCLWQGTSVISGTGRAVVVKTGADTVFGQMAHSLTKREQTSFEKDIKHFGYFLMQITIILCVIILSINIYFNKPLFDSILFALAIAVGMAPELLPAIMTFAMSAGAKRMLSKKVIVSRLSAIYNLGEVNVLCTDKTGTITEGKILVRETVNVHGHPDERVKLYAYLNASMQNGYENPIDDAIRKLKVHTDDYERCNEIPYDFIRKRLSVSVRSQDSHIVITKGAIEQILSICTRMFENGKVCKIDPELLSSYYREQGKNGFRLIGICYKEIAQDRIAIEDEADMIFLGFIILEDPVKEGIVTALEQLRQLDVSVRIITGDNEHVAGFVARAIGISNPRILTGKEIGHMLSEALTVQVLQTDVFASVEPHQKEQIIMALQKSHLVVAYMGDGINDVAAIHAADTGISTENATDVAKQAADLILMEKDLSVLADGIHEGRKTFMNVLKYIFITTGATFGNMLSVAGASLFLPFLPMLPKQILLTNFLTDLPFITISSDNVDSEQTAKPGKWNMRMIRNFMIVFGLHSSFFDFLTFYILYYVLDLETNSFRTGWFVESVLSEIIILYIIRTHKPFYKSNPGKWLMIAGIFTCILTVILPASPVSYSLGLTAPDSRQIIIVIAILLVYIITADLLKIVFFQWHRKREMA